ncbi:MULTISPECIES: IS66 family transposase [Spirulina sp. CCY15215]|uniref:IS66 family transposase n=1 Tax=Spirulina sp. CCY15215 TaxID=2767591 RepID=UPI001950702E|nr:IS66 family transposase [Spirulina major]
MKNKQPSSPKNREELKQMSKAVLVELVLEQEKRVVEQQKMIEKLAKEVERLKGILERDSKTSSKPPSSDLIKRSEKKVEAIPEEEKEEKKRKRDCGSQVSGELPETVRAGQDLGVRLQGMLVWLGHYGHLSYEKQQEWLREFGKIEVGIGTLAATSQRVAEAVKPQVEQLREWVKTQEQVNVDESPWLVKGVKEWMWVICGEGYSLFHAGDTRSRAELEYLLGKSFNGVLCSDDFSVYNGYRVTAQQKCLAHLQRHFRQISQLKSPHQAKLAQAFLDLISEAFTQHRQWRETQEASAYASWAESFKERIQQTIDAWWEKAGHGARLLLRSLLHKSHQWWYFLDHPEVSPDNNRAERSLRLAVTKRKVSGGSRSFEGMERSALLLSVIQSCRAQGRSVVDFFQQALSLTRANDSTSLSLIPQPY